MEKLYLIGFGPGCEDMLTNRAVDALGSAQRVLSTERFANVKSTANPGAKENGKGDGKTQGLSLTELLKELENPVKGETAVLVSGDPGFFSAAKIIIRDFSNMYDIEVIPGIGSISYFSARIKAPYGDASLISLHGRNENIVSKVSYNKKIFALTGGENSVRKILDDLCSHGLGNVSIVIGERLSYSDERILSGKACELQDNEFDELSVIYIENPLAADPHVPLRDGDFFRGDIPMTKEEIRWLAVNKLSIEPGDLVLDIGAGTGSVAVEMARKAYDGFVFAVEAKEEACGLIRKNAEKHGAFNIGILHGEAPDVLDSLSLPGKAMPEKAFPSKAFIGGSSGRMDGIISKLVSLNPDIHIIVTAITLQTLASVMECFERHGISDPDVICVNIAKAKKYGGSDIMAAQNPVYIISGKGNYGNE